MIVQLIPYGGDQPELQRYEQGDRAAQYVARHAQARFSAFPNVYWCIANDLIMARQTVDETMQLAADTIRQVGADMREREPWGTLLTNHQSRFRGDGFVNEPWSDIITVHDLDQVAGELILEYREKGSAPVVLDEDRYEHWRKPQNPRYFFRRLMWASLLSGVVDQVAIRDALKSPFPEKERTALDASLDLMHWTAELLKAGYSSARKGTSTAFDPLSIVTIHRTDEELRLTHNERRHGDARRPVEGLRRPRPRTAQVGPADVGAGAGGRRAAEENQTADRARPGRAEGGRHEAGDRWRSARLTSSEARVPRTPQPAG